jgi:beta-glucosidase
VGLIHDDHFSARWTGFIRPDRSGLYQFLVRSDDGVRVYIDDGKIIDFWSEYSAHLRTARTELEAGRSYRLKLEYYENEGLASIEFGYAYAGEDRLYPAMEAARDADAVIVCVGFNSDIEGEGSDREYHLDVSQVDLIRAMTQATPRTIVVINAGGNTGMAEWIDEVPALIHAWYPGQNGNIALAEIIFWDINPSGKLSATFEKQWEDSPIFGTYPPEDNNMEYVDDIFVGYRHYDRTGVEPWFCFGHGLSYTTFDYSSMAINVAGRGDDRRIRVSFDLKNTGTRDGAETAQLYVRDMEASLPRLVRELKGFEKVNLEAGETRTVSIELDKTALSFYDPGLEAWTTEPGEFEIAIGSLSRDLRLTGKLNW